MAATSPPLRNSYWVIPGQLLAGEHPAGSTTERTRERLKRLLDAGIQCFLDLTQPDELAGYDTLLPAGIGYVRKPILDHSLSADEKMVEILTIIRDCLLGGRPLYVHCRAGIGRTGMVIGCLLVEQGFVGEHALDELNRLWAKCKRSASWPHIPETPAQTDFVRDWRAALQGGLGGLPAAGEAIAAIDPAPAETGKKAVRGNAGARGRQGKGTSEAGPNSTLASAHQVATPIGTPARANQLAAVHVGAPVAPTDPHHMVAPHVSVSARAQGGSLTATKAGKSAMPLDIAVLEPTARGTELEDPLLDPRTLSAARVLRERYLGALLGLALGDAIAAATQFKRPDTFTPVGDLLGGGPFDLPRGAWSDDTAMTLCLADSLLTCNGFDPRDQVERYGLWQQEGYLSATGQCVGITASTARALAVARWRRQPFAGSHDPSHLDPEPLSRVCAPVLFFFASPENSVQQAADAARTTCQAPAVLEACRLLARALHAALSGQPKASILAELPRVPASAPRRNATATSALAAAAWAFSTTASYRDAVLRAANVGGNSDVVASVCGQLAGAHYGIAAIPAAWRNGLMLKEMIEGFADRLLQVALVAFSS